MGRDLEGYLQLFHPEAEIIVPDLPASMRPIVGREGLRQQIAIRRQYIINLEETLTDLVESNGQLIAVGTCKWQLLKQGKTVDTTFTILLRIEQGLITKYHTCTDYADIGGVASWPSAPHE